MMVAYYKLVHGEPEYRAQMLARADGKWIKRADYEADLAAARAEAETAKKIAIAFSLDHEIMRKKAEVERDKALASIAAVRNEAVDWLAARLVDWWGKSNLESNEFLAEFITAAKANIPDAQAALHSMLADAERDMRQRAADTAREAWRDGYDATPHILALPLKHADREEGK